MPESTDNPDKKITLPPRRPDEGPKIYLPARRLSRSYEGSTYIQDPNDLTFRFDTDLNQDPVAHKFILNLVNEANKEHFSQNNRWRNEGKKSIQPAFEVIAREVVQRKFPKYSEPVGLDLRPRNLAIQDAIIRQRNQIVEAGGASFGNLIENNAVVCLEQSIILHALYNEKRIYNRLVGADFGNDQGHAWVEYRDTVTGQDMVADAVWGFNLPKGEAYERYRQAAGNFKLIFKMWLNRD